MNVKKEAEKGENRARSLLSTGILSLLLLVIVCAQCASQPATPTPMPTPTPTPSETFPKDPGIPAIVAAIGGVIAILTVFWYLIHIGVKGAADKTLNKREFRRAIAGSLVVGFSIIAVLSLVFNIHREYIITAYVELVGIVIGFYFGQRGAETAIEREPGSAASTTSEEQAGGEGQEGKGST